MPCLNSKLVSSSFIRSDNPSLRPTHNNPSPQRHLLGRVKLNDGGISAGTDSEPLVYSGQSDG